MLQSGPLQARTRTSDEWHSTARLETSSAVVGAWLSIEELLVAVEDDISGPYTHGGFAFDSHI
jgi:hypothetical protein